jgi:hypothetical protein
MAIAVLQGDNHYVAFPAEQVCDLGDFFPHLLVMDRRQGSIFVGFDFPIGLPIAYAHLAGIDDFLLFLPEFGQRDWVDFYEVAERPEQINLHRPFYPNRPGGSRRRFLVDQLGLPPTETLHRQCEKEQESRRAACPLFWTLGAQQVGKAAIAGWRDLLAPGLRDQELDLAIWPFSGRLVNLFKPGRVIVAETYPAEFYTHLGLGGASKRLRKRIQESRREQADRLLDLQGELPLRFEPVLIEEIREGFGTAKDGEDRFDAVAGLLGMLNLLLGGRSIFEPDDPLIRRIEGWIFGQLDS